MSIVSLRRNSDSGRRAATLLATVFILALGAASTAFMLASMADQPTWRSWAVWGALFGGAAWFLLRLDRPTRKGLGWQTLTFWLQTRDRTNPLETYRFRRRPPETQPRYGTNEPPTLESLQDADQSFVKWVPKGPPPERSRPPGKSR